MRKSLFLCLLCLLLTVLTLSAFAADTVTVIDPIGLLTEEEAETLSAQLSKEPESGVHFYIYTMSAANEDDYPTDGAVLSLCGIAEDEIAVVLVVRHTLTTYYYDMYTYGTAWEMFSDKDIDRILDDFGVYNSLKSGRIAEGCEAFLTLSRQTVSDYFEKEAARQARKPFMVALVGVITAALTAGLTVLVVVLRYRTKKHGESYPLDHYAKLELTLREDHFVGSHISRVRVQSSSSGGGRSGGGGGGRRGGR